MLDETAFRGLHGNAYQGHRLDGNADGEMTGVLKGSTLISQRIIDIGKVGRTNRTALLLLPFLKYTYCIDSIAHYLS